MRQLIATCVVVATSVVGAVGGPAVQLPSDPASVKFAVIGDNGTGQPPQYDVAAQMVKARARFPFEFVIMLGDNLYGRQLPRDFVDKFERPYAPLLDEGIRFFAALGNHDDPTNKSYKGFSMDGERYYSFVRKNVRFYALDTNLMDAGQVAWFDDALKQPDPWKICFFHHPLYSDAGRHGSNVELRVLLEPLLVNGGVQAVFSGHEHVYERLKPQKGIAYFIEGASGQLRKGDIDPSPTMAAAFDQDQTFMLVEIADDELFFQTIARTGRVVDSGVIHRRPTT